MQFRCAGIIGSSLQQRFSRLGFRLVDRFFAVRHAFARANRRSFWSGASAHREFVFLHGIGWLIFADAALRLACGECPHPSRRRARLRGSSARRRQNRWLSSLALPVSFAWSHHPDRGRSTSRALPPVSRRRPISDRPEPAIATIADRWETDATPSWYSAAASANCSDFNFKPANSASKFGCGCSRSSASSSNSKTGLPSPALRRSRAIT